ncbi:response regulator transcription factor [Pseudomonas laurylsulfatiphila]|uniref:response regulator transcription factor n=1 Tax=Pseudomonas laurylsulfatiphila TaxID=2011015 RepID=UPI00215E87F7|nr:response regulator transcription factor [Pseudomonas laurylsulfatiphila]UVM05740.1 response regulator transcription factor [Pseudomonas laurylsulfatiphila]
MRKCFLSVKFSEGQYYLNCMAGFMSGIMIVDDHPVVRLTLRMLLTQEGFEVVAEADNGADAINRIKKQMPHFVILDLDIPQISGLEVIRCITALNLPVSFLVFTAQDCLHDLMSCIQAGARGYIKKTEEFCEVVKALQAAQSGYSYFPSWVNNQSDQVCESKRINLLSQREMDVFRYLVKGVSNRNIALYMSLNEKTISTYKFRVLAKLKADNLVDLVMIAKRYGW